MRATMPPWVIYTAYLLLWVILCGMVVGAAKLVRFLLGGGNDRKSR